MRLGSLSAELDAITREFDYGIVPGSATVFVKDEVNGIGRLDLTLLEGVMIVLEVTDQGYKVTSCSPLCNVDPALSTAHTVQAHLEAPFESMENLLMTISPMFRDRFQQELYNKLQSVQQQQQQQTSQPSLIHMDQQASLSLEHPAPLQPVFTSQPVHNPISTNTSTTTASAHNPDANTNSTASNPNDLNTFDELNHWINQ
ncbi:hypothetical protein V8B55DRAFT_1556503 [Mucor lusitanicus]|uniref:GSKIP domain-containing protein n=2 Tax=Mucor circinelloides f. lusitanicus TaxID=29924 RepID=A0A168HEV5_MUCCL|nr:hypothetical protein FB192DRAFT_1406985 [Mucor lusitanicus]OAC98710.1 hypothetical protein MUCCIDRAFT_114952 [Mucor lusitanicus CBS 277.49]